MSSSCARLHVLSISCGMLKGSYVGPLLKDVIASLTRQTAKIRWTAAISDTRPGSKGCIEKRGSVAATELPTRCLWWFQGIILMKRLQTGTSNIFQTSARAGCSFLCSSISRLKGKKCNIRCRWGPRREVRIYYPDAGVVFSLRANKRERRDKQLTLGTSVRQTVIDK